MNLVLLGAPGAGKGTQAAKIVKKHRIAHISTGDILRKAVQEGTPLGVTAKAYMDKGELVPDLVVIGLVKERLEDSDTTVGFILDGFPRTDVQAHTLDANLSILGRPIDSAISIAVDRDALIKRLTSRRTCRKCGRITSLDPEAPVDSQTCSCGGELYQRDDDTVETVTHRLEVYDRSTAPLIDYYRRKGVLHEINGDRSVAEVFADIESILES